MVAQVLQSKIGTSPISFAPPQVPVVAGDVLVVLSMVIANADPAATTVSGAGATWTRVHLGQESSMWIGANPTPGAPGAVTIGASSSQALFHLRGVAPVLDAATSIFITGAMPAADLRGDPVVPGPNQVVLGAARRNQVSTVGSFLPSPAAWTGVASADSNTNGAWAAPGVTTDSYAYAAHYTLSSGRWLTQALIGLPSGPAAPLDLTAVPGVTDVALSWSAVPTATGYEVRTDAGAPVDVGPVTTHTVAGLSPATSYAFEVRAYSAAGPGDDWATVTVSTLPSPLVDRRWWTHRLAAAVGVDPAAGPVVEVATWSGSSWVVDPTLSNALAGYAITYGRSDARGDVDATRATLTFATPHLVGPTPQIATRLRVQLCQPVADRLGLVDRVRFTGEVTDPLVDHGARLTKLVCVGRLGRAYRQPVTSTGWPVENDAQRIARILAGTGVDVAVGTIDAGSVTLAASTRDDTAARLVEQVTASATGQLVEQPNGTVDWHGPDHRRGRLPLLTLAAATVFRAITWSQRMADLVNKVTVKTADGTQVAVTMPWSADPATGYGPYPASVDTILTTELDARTLAARLVARRFIPAWQLPDLQVDLLRTVTLEQLPVVLQLRHGDRVQLADLPDGCPVPARVFVEGWTEVATPRAWRWTATVSDPIQSGVSVRWMDVPQTAGRTWADVKPGLTWLDALRIEDPDDLFN